MFTPAFEYHFDVYMKNSSKLLCCDV